MNVSLVIRICFFAPLIIEWGDECARSLGQLEHSCKRNPRWCGEAITRSVVRGQMETSLTSRAGVRSGAACYAEADRLRVCRHAGSRIERRRERIGFNEH